MEQPKPTFPIPFVILGALLAMLSLPLTVYALYGVLNPLAVMRHQQPIRAYVQTWSKAGYSKRQMEQQLLKFFTEKEVRRGLTARPPEKP